MRVRNKALLRISVVAVLGASATLYLAFGESGGFLPVEQKAIRHSGIAPGETQP